MSPAGVHLPVLLHAVGWGVLHAVWIGTAGTLLALALLRVVPDAAPGVRHALGLTALLLVAAAPFAASTYMVAEYVEHVDWVRRNQPEPGGRHAAAPPAAQPAGPLAVPGRPAAGVSAPATTAAELVARHRGPYPAPLDGSASRGLGLLVAAAALAWGAAAGRRLARLAREVRDVTRAVALVPGSGGERWATAARAVAARLGLGHPVRVAASSAVGVPMVWGQRAPVILVPTGVLDAVDATCVEAVVAHELAHVKRFDPLAHLAQQVACALAVPNPLGRWLARRVEADRECAADALACRGAACSRADYVRALATLARITPPAAPGAVPFGGRGDLVERVRRLAGPGVGAGGSPGAWGAAAPLGVRVVLAVALAAVVGWGGWTSGRSLLRGSVEIVMEHDLVLVAPSPGNGVSRAVAPTEPPRPEG